MSKQQNNSNERAYMSDGGYNATQNPYKKRKLKKGKIVRITVELLILTAIVVSIFVFKIYQKNNYNRAVEAYKRNKLEKAEKIFNGVGDYKYSKDYLELIKLRKEYDSLNIESTNKKTWDHTLYGVNNKAGGLGDFDDANKFRQRVNSAYEASEYISQGMYQEAYESLNQYSGEKNTCEADLYNKIYFDTFALIEFNSFLGEYLNTDIYNIDGYVLLEWFVCYDEDFTPTVEVDIDYDNDDYQLICEADLEYTAYGVNGDEPIESLIDSLGSLDLYGTAEKENLISTSGYLYKQEIEALKRNWQMSVQPVGRYYYNNEYGNITKGVRTDDK